MNPPIPFARPYMGEEEEAAVLRVLRSGWLTTGSETLAFEGEFAAFLEGPPAPGAEPGYVPGPVSALAVNSATSGLHLALEALGTGPGDLVLVPSYTFTSTAEVVRYLGADAVFVDAGPGSFHMDPLALEGTLDRLARGLRPYPPRGKAGDAEGFGPRGKPRAVIPVHFGGLPCDMEAIMAISARYGLGVIEDAAHAFPSRLPDGRWIGAIGDLGVFSFYATKTITTGEGGMVVGRNRDLLNRIRVMRSHGIDRVVWNRYTDTGASWYYEVVEPGFKYNLPDILAAIGRVQLTRAMKLLEMRREIALRYDEAFRREPFFTLPPSGPADARHLYPLGLRTETLGLNRDQFIDRLKNAGIGVSVHFIPLHIMPYYKKRYTLEEEDFPESLASFRKVVSLPIWPGMTGTQVGAVIAAVISIARGAAARRS